MNELPFELIKGSYNESQNEPFIVRKLLKGLLDLGPILSLNSIHIALKAVCWLLFLRVSVT